MTDAVASVCVHVVLAMAVLTLIGCGNTCVVKIACIDKNRTLDVRSDSSCCTAWQAGIDETCAVPLNDAAMDTAGCAAVQKCAGYPSIQENVSLWNLVFNCSGDAPRSEEPSGEVMDKLMDDTTDEALSEVV
uniref:Uncharacterized protein n=1 Tax=Noctiluca scintillans TaxID=2966 RepID=A0A7S1FDZ1_NOCSC